jgi:hypothetical protein
VSPRKSGEIETCGPRCCVHSEAPTPLALDLSVCSAGHQRDVRTAPGSGRALQQSGTRTARQVTRFTSTDKSTTDCTGSGINRGGSLPAREQVREGFACAGSSISSNWIAGNWIHGNVIQEHEVQDQALQRTLGPSWQAHSEGTTLKGRRRASARVLREATHWGGAGQRRASARPSEAGKLTSETMHR